MSSPIDIQIYFGTTPPCITPVSDRAKKLIAIPEGVDAVITLDHAEVALAAIPGDFMIEKTEEIPNVVAIIEKLAVLH